MLSVLVADVRDKPNVNLQTGIRKRTNIHLIDLMFLFIINYDSD